MGKHPTAKYSRDTGRLTVKGIESAISRAASSRTRIELNDGGGLVLRCAPTGTATWSYAYRAQSANGPEGRRPGKMRRLTLGVYGKTPPALSLEAARKARADEVARKKTGDDPKAAQVRERTAQTQAGLTFGELCDGYIAHIRGHGKLSWKNDYGYLIGGPLPGEPGATPPKPKKPKKSKKDDAVRPKTKWGTRPVNTLTKGEMLAHLETVALASKSTANRMQSALRTLWGWAAERDFIPMNFLAGLKKVGGKETEKERVLASEEITTLFAALNDDEVEASPDVCAALKAILLTAQRPGEVAGMMLSELYDLDGEKPHWIIPAARTKNKKAEHTVPLSPATVRLIKQRLEANKDEEAKPNDQPIFRSRFSARTTLARHSLSQAVRRIVKDTEIARFTPHDLRRTGATIVQANRLPVDFVKALLNHNDKGVTGVYARWHMFEEKREAILAIEAAILALLPAEALPPAGGAELEGQLQAAC